MRTRFSILALARKKTATAAKATVSGILAAAPPPLSAGPLLYIHASHVSPARTRSTTDGSTNFSKAVVTEDKVCGGFFIECISRIWPLTPRQVVPSMTESWELSTGGSSIRDRSAASFASRIICEPLRPKNEGFRPDSAVETLQEERTQALLRAETERCRFSVAEEPTMNPSMPIKP